MSHGAHRAPRRRGDNGNGAGPGTPAAAPTSAAGPSDGQPPARMLPAGQPGRPALIRPAAAPVPSRPDSGGPVFREAITRRYGELSALVDQLGPAAAANGAGLADQLRAVAPAVNDAQLSWLVLALLGYALDVRDTCLRDGAEVDSAAFALSLLLETTAAAASELGVFEYWPGIGGILSGDGPDPA